MSRFSKEFIFGSATSAYQIEGAFQEDGRGLSIWDTFSRIPGKVVNMENGDIACDHYHLYEQDIEVLKTLGVDSYRFSIAWPRIYPEQGKYNPGGMEFYKKLINLLNKNGIKPAVTLYHWDLPLWAHEQGGWTNRDSVKWFIEFAEKCFEELDDKVNMWITHNEPWCAGFLGYHQGIHAPGHTNMEEALKAVHHILLSHGEAVNLLKKKMGSETPIGITLNLSPMYSNGSSINDMLAVNNADGYSNRWFLDPVLKGSYPVDMLNLFSKYVHSFDFIHQGDLEVISTACDFFGINFYSRGLVEYNGASDFLFKNSYSDYSQTAMGWDISPDEFKELIHRLRKEYTTLPIYITENGAAFNDVLSDDKKVHDEERKEYVERHLKAIAELNEEGMNIAGYYLWSLLDNFEWAFGYEKRFGITYVDFETQERIIKDSGFRYAEIIRERTI
ncbi:beta-glucosidase [Bacillus sp. SLBN-46]|uniref:GH1 family beta-glucosidase n=1 Tax=Bacillus sp. SLBN-46 TaxID=3042283 RepID=UPI002854E8E5|nr:GH1 family beta-glucosidase [Bacillus sp. SLBN-46]MDR6124869.1 beta-glucosidase [Bacillus sp. SLBN-46]